MPKTQKSGQSCQLTANVFQEYLKERKVEEGNSFIVCLLRFLTRLLYWLYGL